MVVALRVMLRFLRGDGMLLEVWLAVHFSLFACLVFLCCLFVVVECAFSVVFLLSDLLLPDRFCFAARWRMASDEDPVLAL